MLNLIKPKYFMPIYGDLYFRSIHKRTAMTTGFKEDNILMVANGQIVDFAPNNT
jgi:ribonuclease J